ncbi:hypothetical protein [Ammoniphilus sp. CFH 90114]|uniref:hypothetical protein n=1 Tax=Ammoniphilus sp. CFH 90114 TaxID=2493665 RepID=UPI00100ED249|nr:hypothetical protein [Ammoniphilus sp. CFH 90114]RXT02771.1 hypothetical protein EIZ39_24565 [Ammoniphilus sp. CFH 90114]
MENIGDGNFKGFSNDGLNLPENLFKVTAEIKLYRQMAETAILRMGELLKQAKEEILRDRRGTYEQWVKETLLIDISYARKCIKIFEEHQHDPVFRSMSNGIESIEKLYNMATFPKEKREQSILIPSKGVRKLLQEMTVAEIREAKKYVEGKTEEESSKTKPEPNGVDSLIEEVFKNIIEPLWCLALLPYVGTEELKRVSQLTRTKQEELNEILLEFPNSFIEVLELTEINFSKQNIIAFLELKVQGSKFIVFFHEIGWYLTQQIPDDILIKSYTFKNQLDDLDRIKLLSDNGQISRELQEFKLYFNQLRQLFRFILVESDPETDIQMERAYHEYVRDTVNALVNLKDTFKTLLLENKISLNDALEIQKLSREQQEILKSFMTSHNVNYLFLDTILDGIKLGYNVMSIKQLVKIARNFFVLSNELKKMKDGDNYVYELEKLAFSLREVVGKEKLEGNQFQDIIKKYTEEFGRLHLIYQIKTGNLK